MRGERLKEGYHDRYICSGSVSDRERLLSLPESKMVEEGMEMPRDPVT